MTIAVKDKAVSAIFQPDNSGAVKDRMLIIAHVYIMHGAMHMSTSSSVSILFVYHALY